MSINKIILVGNVGRDPDGRYALWFHIVDSLRPGCAIGHLQQQFAHQCRDCFGRSPLDYLDYSEEQQVRTKSSRMKKSMLKRICFGV
jgi:hypothetical protein